MTLHEWLLEQPVTSHAMNEAETEIRCEADINNDRVQITNMRH